MGSVLTGLIMEGFTTDEAAREVGVHPSTVYRWQNRHPHLYEDMLCAGRIRFRLRHLGDHGPRPRVSWRRDCPECGADLVVRTAGGMAGFKFYRCERWEEPRFSPSRCLFASWRPPVPGSCPGCGGVLFWSHSRKSIGCDSCGYRRRQV